MSGETTYVTEGIGGVFGEGILRFDAVDIQLAHSLKRELTIRDDDPLSARYVLTQSYEMGREGWRTRVEHPRADAQRPGPASTCGHPDRAAGRRARGRAAMGRDDSPRPRVSSRRALGFLRDGLPLTMHATSDAAPAHKTVFGQPRGLATLFLTEMWERFSYYGMRSILILYAVAAVSDGGFGLDDHVASAIYGLYIAATYVFALFGGWMADRLLGAQRAVIAGGILIMCGNALLVLGRVPVLLPRARWSSCSAWACSSPTSASWWAELYPEGGARRDAGFSIFYVGISVGALLGSLLVPLCAAHFGWRWGFSLPVRRHAARPRASSC